MTCFDSHTAHISFVGDAVHCDKCGRTVFPDLFRQVSGDSRYSRLRSESRPLAALLRIVEFVCDPLEDLHAIFVEEPLWRPPASYDRVFRRAVFPIVDEHRIYINVSDYFLNNPMLDVDANVYHSLLI